MILHAGLIARLDPAGWRGVLIEGASGSGKSDLALRALDAGWALVADDRTLIWTSGGRLYGRAAPALAGLVEARGLGVLGERSRPFAPISLDIRCVEAASVERMPEFQTRILLDVEIPRLDLVAKEASATAKLTRALSRLGLGAHPAYQACRVGSPRPAAGGDPVRFRE
jgi:serine kinase of HPr protein (carbohydrate metabolism regulator)